MTFILLILAALMVCFFVYSFKNRYAIFLALMMVSVTGIFYSVLTFIYRTGYYYYSSHILGILDYSFFRKLTSLTNDYNTILRIHNISAAVYMVCVAAFTILYFRHKLKFNLKTTLFLIFPLFYIFFYDPRITYLMYIFTADNTGGVLYKIICAVDIINYILMFVYALMPLFYVFRFLKAKSTLVNKKRNILVAVSLCVIDVFFLIILCVGLIRKPYFMEENFLLVHKMDNTLTSETYLLLSFAGVMLVAFMVYMISRFSMTAKIGFFRQHLFRHNLNELNKNYINVFHSVKNIIYSYKLQLEKARNEQGEDKERTLRELEDKIDHYVKRISFMLDMENNNLEFEQEPKSLQEIVDETLINYDTSKIKIEKLFDKNFTVNVDMFYMADALLNIIQNSSDAIEKTDRDGRIRFEGSSDGEWAVLKISDNGCGMTKKEISNLFRPFYTTKSRITNWGVGLSFTYRIIHFHGGYVSVESVPDKGTDFYIYLPLTYDTECN